MSVLDRALVSHVCIFIFYLFIYFYYYYYLFFFFFFFFLQDSEKYVEQLLELFNKFSKLVKEAFIDDPRFLTSRDKAYKSVVNDISVFKLELPSKTKG